MYIYLLAWRYLRTRFIAVASIISVTLGVATLIVVNAVMAGFVDQMHERLHGILSDIEIAPPGLGEIHNVGWHVNQIQEIAGGDLEAVTTIVRVPALLQFNFAGRPMTHQLLLVGIDDATYGKVTDFQPFLMNELNREQVSFDLRGSGYDPVIGECGWNYRRTMAEYEEAYRRQVDEIYGERMAEVAAIRQPEKDVSGDSADARRPLPELPDVMPVLPPEGIRETATADSDSSVLRATDSSVEHRPAIDPEDIFNKARDQYAGIIIGRAISHRQVPESKFGPAHELYLLKPGDDVYVTLPTAGHEPKPIMENFTVVDLYSSQMHEYDSTFAFMSLSHLQKIRGMIDPARGTASVSSIQIRTRPGTDLAKLRDRLTVVFPLEANLMVQTWQDTQRPLLNAVNLELTILNILLFLIIGVAGFGILATFFMIVVEKTRDIGILKSLGAPGRGVMAIFLGYGLSLGTVGTGAGILLGLIFVWNINAIADAIAVFTGTEVYDPMIYFFDEIPTIVSPWMVVWVAFGAIAIAVLASVLPSLRAARLRPVESLRFE